MSPDDTLSPLLYSLVPSVYTSVYSSLLSFSALSLNFAPAETSESASTFKFLVKLTVSENEVVISPVLFVVIMMTATPSEIRAMPKVIYKTKHNREKVEIHKMRE